MDRAAVVLVPRCLDFSRRDLLVRKHPAGARMKRNFAPFFLLPMRVRETQDLHEARLVFLKGAVRSSQGLSLSYTQHTPSVHFPCTLCQSASPQPALISPPPPGKSDISSTSATGRGTKQQTRLLFLSTRRIDCTGKQTAAPSVEQEMSAAS